jgi:hypothetical protein
MGHELEPHAAFASCHRRLSAIALAALLASVAGWCASSVIAIPRVAPLLVAIAAVIAGVAVVLPAVRGFVAQQRAGVRAIANLARAREAPPTRVELRTELVAYLRQLDDGCAFRTDEVIDAVADYVLRDDDPPAAADLRRRRERALSAAGVDARSTYAIDD